MDRQNYLARKTFNNTNTVNSKSGNSSKSNFIPGNKKQNSFTTKQKKK